MTMTTWTCKSSAGPHPALAFLQPIFLPPIPASALLPFYYSVLILDP